MKKKTDRPAESRDRVFIGIENMDKLKALADKMGEKMGVRPSVHQVIDMLIRKAK